MIKYDLLIRTKDGKCRAIDRDKKPLTGWCKTAQSVIDVMRRKSKLLS